MSPAIIIEGKPNPDMKKRRITFGLYALVFIGTNNSMKRKSIPAIALNKYNDHGKYYFMNLYTGKQLHSYIWQELPIDEEIIARI